tara:strand:+ start:585 stop:815 length:231 start_codon:yes stop_codon:yes gene_type:complete
MTEEKEMILLLKELVSRIKALESVTFNDDNLLMKSGFVVANTPTPSIDNKVNSTFDMNDVANMSFDDMEKIISKME